MIPFGFKFIFRDRKQIGGSLGTEVWGGRNYKGALGTLGGDGYVLCVTVVIASQVYTYVKIDQPYTLNMRTKLTSIILH